MTRKRPTIRPGTLDLLGASAELAQGEGASPAATTLPVAALSPGQQQPRRTFGEVGLETLAQSIREQGVLQPLLVRPVGERHEIVAGERRWRAARLAGLTEVPVVIREMSDHEARAAALMENLQRENLNLLDEVDAKLDLVALVLGRDRDEARARLLEMRTAPPGPDHEALTRLFSGLGETWESFAKNKLRVLGWPPTILAALREGGLPFTHAGVAAAAPVEHHAELLALAQGGASRSELQAAAARLRTTHQPEVPVGRVMALGKRLTSRRLLSRLTPRDLQALERWLDKMPAQVREALEQEGAGRG